MLVKKLFNATLLGAEWVLYLLIALSIVSIGICALCERRRSRKYKTAIYDRRIFLGCNS